MAVTGVNTIITGAVRALCEIAPKNRPYLGPVAQNAITSAPNPPATTTFGGFHPSKLPQTPVPRPNAPRQAARGSPKRWVPKWVKKVHRVQKNDFFEK